MLQPFFISGPPMQTGKLLQNLERTLDNCMLADRWKLRNELRQLQRALHGKEADEQHQQRLATLAERVAASIARCEQRKQQVPAVINYPQSLPVVARLDDLKAAITTSQVVIIAGETG